MPDFWVIDTKCKVLPESTLPQDGSTYYYGRSVVPAISKENAIEQLAHELEEDHILIEKVAGAVLFEEGQWDEDDEFEVHESIGGSKVSHQIELGCFVSEKARLGKAAI
ncbi:hypothetical protein [Hahella ganghwensis]|uniref:hypothetical protein n=1 Tax=Hahella ganghwensis TaxID=286420 RepID=UPI000378F407|nr:hypothetical protein [Hahella ganghwensis]